MQTKGKKLYAVFVDQTGKQQSRVLLNLDGFFGHLSYSLPLRRRSSYLIVIEMKFQILVFLLVLTLVVSEELADKPRKHKKVRRVRKPAAVATEPKAVDNEVEVPPEPDSDLIDNRVPVPDPCSSVHCGAGRVCKVDENEEPQCVCIPACPVETEPRRKVCSNHNETWSSDCAIYQHRCWCDKGDDRCLKEDYKHVHIEYYGECREMPECTDDEMADFPRRMRDWLFNIMRDLADRQDLAPHYLKMEREAENNYTKRWANAAIWKWCDLDGHPPDRSVSRHELFPIRAPLMALEHCIAPFLNSCDPDNNHRITLKEWAKCLELDEEDIEEKCEDIEEEWDEE